MPAPIQPSLRSPAFVVMGVCGTGKSTVASLLSEALPFSVFLEGDEYHPAENITLMAAGIALNDNDRVQWLSSLGKAIESNRQMHITVCSCSALKRQYRDQLRQLSPDLGFIFLDGDKDLIERRMSQRDHFMPSSLLSSQLATLEKPEPYEPMMVTCNINQPPADIVKTLLSQHGPQWLKATANRR